MSPASTQKPLSLAARLVWLSVFGAAFGFLEAAVVVYLRALFYPQGFQFPLAVPPLSIGLIELAREVATLLMLLAVACLTARSAWGRFGAFAFVFGVWDLIFYIGLRATVSWPTSLTTWDVLFLIPGVWTGPVWSVVFISFFLVICGAWILIADGRGHHPTPGFLGWVGGTLSFGLLLLSFLWNHRAASHGEVPAWFPWPLWLAGVMVGLGIFFHLFRPARWESPQKKP